MLREGPFFECTQNIFPVHWKKFSSALQKIRELTQTANRVNSAFFHSPKQDCPWGDATVPPLVSG